MRPYLELMQKILDEGVERSDRTGVGTKSLFGHQLRFDLAEGFPLVTTKRVHLRSIIHELLWFLRGETNIAYLSENKVRIWDEWADAEGELGPVYGKQWRSWATPDGQTIDQMAALVDALRQNPHSRRHVISAWNVAEGKLSCQLYQRSADVFLGVPFNIASYALLTMMIAKVVGLEYGDFVHSFGDVHLYLNHLEQARTQLAREPRPRPQMQIKRVPESLFEFRYEDFELVGYEPHPRIKAQVAV